MNAGVSITPCPVLSRPERAFVLLSVALTSNIGGTLEMIAPLASKQSSWRKTGSPWQACYWTALAVVFTWAIWQRFALPLTPIADPDTWGYLSPALRKLTGAEFAHGHARNLLFLGTPANRHSGLRKRNCVDFTLAGIGETELLVRRHRHNGARHYLLSAIKLGAAKNRARPGYSIDCIASAVAGAHPESQGRGEPDFLAHNALRYSCRSDSRSNGRGPPGTCQPSIFHGLARARLCRIE